jgi:hypothetical protein
MRMSGRAVGRARTAERRSCPAGAGTRAAQRPPATEVRAALRLPAQARHSRRACQRMHPLAAQPLRPACMHVRALMPPMRSPLPASARHGTACTTSQHPDLYHALWPAHHMSAAPAPVAARMSRAEQHCMHAEHEFAQSGIVCSCTADRTQLHEYMYTSIAGCTRVLHARHMQIPQEGCCAAHGAAHHRSACGLCPQVAWCRRRGPL